MAGEDTRIVDFQSMESAISRFTQIRNRIGEDVSKLEANAAKATSAIQSAAGETYVSKLDALKKNFLSAQSKLDEEISDLKSKLEAHRATESAAQQKANAISSFTLQ
uniref:Uncharacterized protein n=1 Tax=Eubacterium cellulosolvens (strain ATCC 43171 / JCM 9499 / 6) TaxID=633697 RepID=I5AXE3_EUBC6